MRMTVANRQHAWISYSCRSRHTIEICASVGLALIPMMTSAPAAAAANLVCIVREQEILEQSVPSKEASAKLIAEFSPRQKALQATNSSLQELRNKNNASPQGEAELHRIGEQFAADVNRRRAEELKRVKDQIGRATNQISSERGCSRVHADTEPTAPTDIDITADVLRSLAVPLDVRSHLLKTQIVKAVERKDDAGVLSGIETYREMVSAVDLPLLYLEAQTAFRLKQYERAKKAPEEYFGGATQNDSRYADAKTLYATVMPLLER